MRFSTRLPERTDPNAIARAVAGLRAQGAPVIDLADSNPTTVGLPYPDELLRPLGDPCALVYEPDPFGLLSARQAVAADCARRNAAIDPAHVVLSASTSEAYSWLFKLLCDPGESVLVPQPSYPLFEHLTRFEGVRAVPYRLEYHGRWEIDGDSLAAAPSDTRAVVVVTPNNPTGSFVTARELAMLADWCRRRRAAIIADEVFADYALDEARPLTDLAARAEVLTFTLGGASKTLGLPQIKLAWTIVGGPARDRDAALAALDVIADAYLSVGTPVQCAASRLFAAGAAVRLGIHERVRRNLAQARAIARRHPACDVLRVEGGWSAVVRVPATRSEDALVLDILARERVRLHPGYFFDFPHEAFLVVSLLPPEDRFADAFERALRVAAHG